MTENRWDAVDRYFKGSGPDSTDSGLMSVEASKRRIGRGQCRRKEAAPVARHVDRAETISRSARSAGTARSGWRALPDGGRLVSLEIDPAAAAVARANARSRGIVRRVEVRIRAAVDSLASREAAGFGPVDFAFIDADKQNNVAYFQAALRMSRPGELIVIDNVVQGGRVTDPDSTDPSVIGTRAVVEAIAAEPRVAATALQTVGNKGWDGFILATVIG
ncbi:MAG: class I SAM-dependent methyltransferase [Thermomicrobiales bacterium]